MAIFRLCRKFMKFSLSISMDSIYTPSRRAKRLLMLYDKPSGSMAVLSDATKKLFNKECKLALIGETIGAGEEKWKKLEEALNMKIDHFYNDEVREVERSLGQKIRLPCVIAELEDGSMEILLSHLTIKNLEKSKIQHLEGEMRHFMGNLRIWARAMDIRI